ncbi:hypothetical protein D3C80_1614260 [compost metagenome]
MIFPCIRYESSLHQLPDVSFQGQQGYIRLESSGNRPGLGARSFIGLLEYDLLAGLGLPLRCEQRQNITHRILYHTIGTDYKRQITLLRSRCTFRRLFTIPAAGQSQYEHCQH